MDQNRSWEANRSSATQQISRILWNVKVYYRIRKSPPFVPVLSQIDPIHISQPTSRIYIFVSSICVSVFQVVSFPQISSLKPCMHLSSPSCVLHSLSIPVFLHYHPNDIRWEVRSMNLPVTSSLRSKYPPYMLFSKTLSLCFSLDVSSYSNSLCWPVLYVLQSFLQCGNVFGSLMIP